MKIVRHIYIDDKKYADTHKTDTGIVIIEYLGTGQTDIKT